MVEKTDFRGVINPVKAIPEAEQRELIGKYEPSETYNIGKDGTQDLVIRQQRPPRAVVVSDAALLGEQRGYKDARFDSFLWFKAEIHKPGRGGFILEARTGRRSDRPKDWLAMRRDAERMCGRLAQGAKSALNAKKGKKPYVPTPEEKRVMREEWHDVRHKTVDDAVAAIKKRLGKRAPGRTKIYAILGSPYERRE
jgi:hypothetical protein